MVVLVAALVGIIAVVGHWSSRTTTTQPSHPASYSSAVVVPFTDLFNPQGVAVDTGGNVYVADNETAGC